MLLAQSIKTASGKTRGKKKVEFTKYLVLPIVHPQETYSWAELFTSLIVSTGVWKKTF